MWLIRLKSFFFSRSSAPLTVIRHAHRCVIRSSRSPSRSGTSRRPIAYLRRGACPWSTGNVTSCALELRELTVFLSFACCPKNPARGTMGIGIILRRLQIIAKNSSACYLLGILSLRIISRIYACMLRMLRKTTLFLNRRHACTNHK